MTPPTILAAALALVSANVAAAQPGPGGPLPADQYVATAGANDRYMIESSRLVLPTGDTALKSYAELMVEDHRKAIGEVSAAAVADGVPTAPATLLPKQAAMIGELKKTSGPAREALYKRQQIEAQTETLALQNAYAAAGDRPNLKTAAAKIAPVVEVHLIEAKAMARQ